MKIYSLFFFIMGFCWSNSQQLPLDFENNSFPFSSFSGSGFSFRGDPSQAGNQVGEFFNDGAAAYQGFFIDLGTPVDLDNDSNLSLRFYAFDPNSHNIIVKLENGINTDIEVSTTVVNSQNSWTTLNFDFSNATETATGSTVTGTGTYSRITLFIDGGSLTPGTYLIDDINNNAVVGSPSNPIDVVYTDLVWSDEFNTPGFNNPVDPTKWFHQTQMITPIGWANGEIQHYTNRLDNSYVENGMLHIVAKRENFTDQGETKQYTSARLNSKFAFTHGRVDVRAKLPIGDGTWPAIWMLGKNINEDGGYWDSQFGTTNWPLCGEIDIMEHGLGPVNQVSAALHTNCSGCFGATMNYQPFMLSDVANTFHIYSVNWSPQQITFLIDDVPFYTYNPTIRNVDTWPFDADQYLLLNVAMGGIAGTVDPNFVQSDMQIDYVRIYQNVLSLDDESSYTLKLYPNPAKERIIITSSKTIDELYIFDMMGKQVHFNQNNIGTIDVSQFSNGTYLLKARIDDIVMTDKIIIHH
ncbi:beta-glucanase [Nonlabens tegetincola]|uniref:family 16 glycosylhydrolase n=1 Tax=Nonlabens tegetincola TaxID=323273 RepID=UPI000A203050|nr:family 16 glycosylhydrolase [Nonlabens tegetincola]ARN72405.1 beta-glucanase [Nonlabens tegetincola]